MRLNSPMLLYILEFLTWFCECDGSELGQIRFWITAETRPFLSTPHPDSDKRNGEVCPSQNRPFFETERTLSGFLALGI